MLLKYAFFYADKFTQKEAVNSIIKRLVIPRRLSKNLLFLPK
ncbi:hypothetical protein FIC_00010 [Flavobacteriaceae bacterium 3519-10]|nr:hypothetical protein FIC_00010 [Flavobacteriaceae bacterium 3519-10]